MHGRGIIWVEVNTAQRGLHMKDLGSFPTMPKCKQCGQVYHINCCNCSKKLPKTWDDYECEECIDGNITRNLAWLEKNYK